MQITKCLILSFLILMAGTVMADKKKVVLGYVERATLVDKKRIDLSAKLDTGAKTASLSAINIHEFEKDGEIFIAFTVPTKAGPVEFEKPLFGQVKIKMRSGEVKKQHLKKTAVTRPVVLMDIKIGDDTQSILVNLTNRKRFLYPLLLGRNAIIKYEAIIDPSRTFVVKPQRVSLNP